VAWIPETESEREWALLSAACPQVAATMGRYLAERGDEGLETWNRTSRQVRHGITHQQLGYSAALDDTAHQVEVSEVGL
jgi:hypothetical protein